MDKLKLSPKLAVTAALSAIVGGLAVQQSASAMGIGDGRIDINLVGALEVTSNTVNVGGVGSLYDFPVNEGGAAEAAGTFNITVVDGYDDFPGFVQGGTGVVYDIIPSVPNELIDEYTTAPLPDFENLPARDALGVGGDLLLDFDDNNLQYFFRTVTRTTTPFEGGFINNFSFDGFYRDTTGEFDDTDSTLAIFTAATDINITAVPSTPGTTPQEVVDAFVSQGEFAGINGVIRTSESVPEPGTVLGLLAIGGLGLGLKKKKQS